MSATLKSKAIHGIFWSSLERIAQQGTQFVITIILARLLVPEQFGLIGMLFVFIALAWVFLDSGFGSALIQKKEATVVDECSMFYFNILVGFLGTGLLCAAAPWIAAFYRQPILTPLTRVLSLAILLNSFASVQTTLLSKRLDFKTQLKVNVAATGLSGTIAIALAIKGFGVWSLVGEYVGNSFFRSLFLWCLSPWRPKPVFSFRSLREMFTFGSRLLASSLLNTIFDNIYPVIIGRLFSATQLGLYASASRIQRLPTLNITGVVIRVAFPVFSMIQDDPVHLKRSMRKAATVLAFVFFPLMTGLALLARPLVHLLLREEWIALVPWLQLLCLAGVLYPFHALHLNLLTAKGRSDLFFRLEVLKKILTLVAVVVTYRWGVTAMIWGQVVLSALCYYINSYYTNRLIHYSLREQLADLAPYAMTSILMGMSLYGIQAVPFPENGLSLVLAVLMGGTLYLALSRLLGLSALIETTQVVARSLSRP
jgi:teichuronic acid exporter